MKITANILDVNISKIRNNIKKIKEKTNSKFFAVVKANAYGLGADVISREIEKDVDMFCVANIDEAIELRLCGIKKDILVFGYIPTSSYHYLEKYNIIATIYNFDIAKEIEKSKYKIRAHIKLETGHNRIGFQNTDESIEQIKEILKIENILIEGIYSHLSNADIIEDTYSEKQNNIFLEILNKLPESDKWIKHLSNSAGSLKYDYIYDAVRIGISMYGVYPSWDFDKSIIDLECSFELRSSISHIKKIKAGESVSYGRRFIANSDMRVATVSIGYADGYSRRNSGKAYVLIKGKKCPVIGTITMDQLMVDISNVECNLRDEVILIGKSKGVEIGVYEVASWSDTISYEVMTSISRRVPRNYIY